MILIKKIKGSTLLQSLSANALSQLLNVFIQLLGVPILIKAFGVEQYGEYLVLSSIPSFLLYADLGLGISLGNQITTVFSRNKFVLTRILCDTYVIFSLCLAAVLITGGAIFSFFFDFKKSLNLSLFSNSHYAVVFFILLFTVILSHITGIVSIFLRALNKNALGVNILTGLRVCITISFWLGAIFSKSLIISSLSSLICGVIIIISTFTWYEIKYKKILPVRMNNFSKKKLKEAVKPGLSFLLLAIGNSLLLQGTTIIVNKFLGPVQVVLFNSTRTLSNFIKQGIILLNNSIWAEYNILVGKRNLEKIRSIFTKSNKISVGFACLSSLAAILFGKFVFKLWLGNEVEFNLVFYSLMIITNIFYAGWSTASILPFAMNKFRFIGLTFFTNSVLSLFLIFMSASYFDLLFVIPGILILNEIAMIIITRPFSKKQLSLN